MAKSIKVDITADVVKFQRGVDQAITKLERFEYESKRRSESMTVRFNQLAGVVAGIFATRAVIDWADQVRRISDEYTNLNARLSLVTDSADDLAEVQQGLYKVSQETGTSYAANADSYAKLAVAMRDLGASSRETLKLSELVNKSLVVNGSSAEMAASFMLQFSQAMGSGVLQGDEFRAMMESNSYFAQQLAKALNTNIAGLREMSKEGKLTADVIRGALPKMVEEINESFARIPPTTERALTALRNAFEKIIADSDKAGEGTKSIAGAISDLTAEVEANKEEIVALIASMISKIPDVINAIKSVGGTLASLGDTLIGLKSVSDALGGPGVMQWGVIGAFLLHGQPGAAGLLAALFTINNALKQYNLDLGHLVDTWHEYDAAVRNLGDVALGKRDWNTGNYKTSVGQIVEDTKKSFADLNASVDAAISKSLEMSEQAAQGAAAAATASAKEQVEVQKAALDEMRKEYQKYADEISKLWDQIVGRERSLTEQLRSMARGSMDSLSAWKDLRAEADEYKRSAEEAAAAGDFKTAVELADKARQKYADLNKEVKAGDKMLISQQKAQQTAMAGVEAAGRLAIEALKKQKQAAEDAQQALDDKSGGKLSDELKKAKQSADEVSESAEVMGETMVKAINEFGVQAAEEFDKIDRWLKSPHKMTIEIEKVGDTSQGYATGGRLAGYGGGDIVPALLEPGEYIIRKEAVARFGSDLFNQLNSLRLPDFSRYAARFASGGPVAAASGGSSALRHEHVLRFGGQRAVVHTDDINAEMLTRVLRTAWEASS